MLTGANRVAVFVGASLVAVVLLGVITAGMADLISRRPTGTEAPGTSVSGAPGPAGELVEQGRYLATIGNCGTCHTRPGASEFAGGVAFKTPFGTIYSTNISPDGRTGIGSWSEQDFVRAMRYGKAANGHYLYPAFP